MVSTADVKEIPLPLNVSDKYERMCFQLVLHHFLGIFSHISKTADEPKKLVKSSVERFEPKLKEPLERNND